MFLGCLRVVWPCVKRGVERCGGPEKLFRSSNPTFSSRPKSDDLGHQIFKSKHGIVSKFNMLSAQLSSSKTIGDTAVKRHCFTPDAQSAVGCLSAARLQSVGAGSGLQTKRSAPGAHLSVDTYSVDYSSRSSQSVSLLGSHAMLCQNTKHQDRLTRAHSALLFAARLEAAGVGSDAWALRPVQRTWCISSRRQTTARPIGIGVAQISARAINALFSHRKTVSICELHS